MKVLKPVFMGLICVFITAVLVLGAVEIFQPDAKALLFDCGTKTGCHLNGDPCEGSNIGCTCYLWPDGVFSCFPPQIEPPIP
ncbi:MAG: hypothetical protein ACM3SY_11840 [Candidatus Omnitrophota bacterium]